MATVTRVNFIKEHAMEVAYIIFSEEGDMKAIGSMENMMGMGLKAGQKEADTEGNIGMG